MKKGLIIGLAVALVLGLATMGMAVLITVNFNTPNPNVYVGMTGYGVYNQSESWATVQGTGAGAFGTTQWWNDANGEHVSNMANFANAGAYTAKVYAKQYNGYTSETTQQFDFTGPGVGPGAYVYQDAREEHPYQVDSHQNFGGFGTVTVYADVAGYGRGGPNHTAQLNGIGAGVVTGSVDCKKTTGNHPSVITGPEMDIAMGALLDEAIAGVANFTFTTVNFEDTTAIPIFTGATLTGARGETKEDAVGWDYIAGYIP